VELNKQTQQNTTIYLFLPLPPGRSQFSQAVPKIRSLKVAEQGAQHGPLERFRDLPPIAGLRLERSLLGTPYDPPIRACN